MELIFEPLSPWNYLALGIAGVSPALIVLGVLRPTIRRRVFGRRPITWLVAVVFWLLAAGLLAAAVWNPILIQRHANQGPFLAVVIDVSDSTRRSEGGWPAIQDKAYRWLKASIDSLPADLRRTAHAGLVTFGDGASDPVSDVPISALLDELAQLRPEAPGDATDIAAGLDRAGQLVKAGGGQGVIVLFSDGLQTRGDALAAAQALARQGIAVMVIPISGRAPEVALLALDLPRRVDAGANTYVRGLLWNNRPQPVPATLGMSINAGAPARVNQADPHPERAQSVQLPASGWARLREPIAFSGPGLQFVDLRLQAEDAAVDHRRRSYTFVHEPPRLLAIGGDQSWISAFPSNEVLITPVSPGELAPDLPLSGYDAIVINAVPAGQFPAGALERVARAVTDENVGLFLINGGQNGVPVTEPSLLRSYGGTPLDPLLPVSPDPRMEIPEPPPRQVVFLIDSSGSMDGVPIEKAKQIARYLVEKYMRPQDTLDLLYFTTEAYHPVNQRAMDAAGKQFAIDEINKLYGGGGTDPNQALEQIAGRRMKNCGLIFISDGEFGAVNYRPDCQTVVFAIGAWQVPDPGSPLWKLAEPIPAPYDFNPAGIEMPYFKPKPRDKFFEPDMFTPISVDLNAGRLDELPVPQSPLPGSAVAYPRQEADVIAVRPNKTVDPILAYRSDPSGGGSVGVFTSALAPEWLAGEAERAALRRWLLRVVAYSARERYDLKLTDLGGQMEISVSILPGADQRIPQVDRLTGWLEIDRQRVADLTLSPDAINPAGFRGVFQPPYSDQPRWARLVLQEIGPDALRTVQKIPVLLPPQTELDVTLAVEDYSFGTDEALLRQLAEAGGGKYDPQLGTPAFLARPLEQPCRPLWPWFVVVGMFAYLLAFLFHRLEQA